MITDKNWHHVCHAWSSTTSAVIIYVDGQQVKTDSKPLLAATGFTLSFGPVSNSQVVGNKLLLSQVNVWDRILPSQEISTLFARCNAGEGNIGSWARMYDASKEAMYSKPSTCAAPAEDLGTDPTAPARRGPLYLRKRPNNE